MTPAQIRIVRIILGVLAVFFAHWLGRSAVARWQGRGRRSQLLAWVLRTSLALGGVFWMSRLDAVAIATAVSSALSLAFGAYLVARPRKVESQRLGLIDDDEKRP